MLEAEMENGSSTLGALTQNGSSTQGALTHSSKLRAKLLRPKVIGIAVCVAAVIALGAAIGARAAFSNSTDVWDGTSDISWYKEGMTSMAITTAEQLAGMRELANDEGIDMKGIRFTPEEIRAVFRGLPAGEEPQMRTDLEELLLKLVNE